MRSSHFHALGTEPHALGAEAPFARINRDEDLAGPAIGRLVLPAVVTKLAGAFDDDLECCEAGWPKHAALFLLFSSVRLIALADVFELVGARPQLVHDL